MKENSALCACKQINRENKVLLHLHIFCDISIFLPQFMNVPCFHPFFLPSFLTPAAHKVKNHQTVTHCFFFSSLSATLTQCVNLSLSHSCFGCLTPHTHFASLVSRTLATRTVMSSMRSWILQLWPPLPAHEALLTLAMGILSSMQPSSLAHTSACHYRPFPSVFGLKVHRLMHSFPSLISLLHIRMSLFILHMVSSSASLASLSLFLSSPAQLCWS